MPTPFSTEPGSPDVVQSTDGRWFINMGRPGFNSPTNNRGGWPTEAGARTLLIAYRARAAKKSRQAGARALTQAIAAHRSAT